MRGGLWMTIGAALLFASCGGGGDATPTATSVPTAAPTATEEPAAHLVFMRGDDLWTSDADGSNATQLSSGGKAGFAGLGLDPNGQSALYYTLLDEATRELTMYRVVEGEGPAEMFSFQGSDKNAEFYAGNASVSAAGDVIAFSDEDGLALYFPNIGNTRRLLGNEPCGTATRCWSYFFPTWSPDGTELSAEKIFFEGGRTVIVNQGEDPATDRELEYGTNLGHQPWSADGRLCVQENSYAGGPALVLDVDTGAHTPALPDPTAQAASYLLDCAWSSDNKLALTFTSGPTTQVHVAAIAADGALLLDTVPNADATGRATVRWLDESSLVVEYADAPAVVLGLDGTSAPLGADIDRLIAVVYY